jgi:hypothetical protein
VAQLNRIGIIPVVKLMVIIHDRNDVIEPTDALELTAGRQMADVLLREVVGTFLFFFLYRQSVSRRGLLIVDLAF